mgnify:CR=1 FL=1
MGAQPLKPVPRAWLEPFSRLRDHGIAVRIDGATAHYHVHHTDGLRRHRAWSENTWHQPFGGGVSRDDHACRHRGKQCHRLGGLCQHITQSRLGLKGSDRTGRLHQTSTHFNDNGYHRAWPFADGDWPRRWRRNPHTNGGRSNLRTFDINLPDVTGHPNHLLPVRPRR